MDQTAVPAAAPRAPVDYRYALALLMMIYVVNFIDRQIITILAEPIKHDLDLKDWQLGVLTGFAFALFYTVLGIPIARLADRHSRPAIIGWSVAVWSLFTAFCGMGQNFIQMLLFRIGVGVGEAGCSPPAHSLITDYVPQEKRARALAFYAMGGPIGALLGMALGGLIAQAYGWRVAFFVAAGPGLLFSVLALTTLKETRDKVARDAAKAAQAAGSLGQSLKYLMSKPTFWFAAWGIAGTQFMNSGVQSFAGPFFLRNQMAGLETLAAAASEALNVNLQPLGFLGLALGITTGIAGAAGVLTGGFVADRFGAKDRRGYLLAPAIGSMISVPMFVIALSSSSVVTALLFKFLGHYFLSMQMGPIYAIVQSVAPARLRATASAVLLFLLNIVGAGFGPLIVGGFSDWLQAAYGMSSGEGLRLAIIAGCAAGVIGSLLFFAGMRTIRRDCET